MAKSLLYLPKSIYYNVIDDEIVFNEHAITEMILNEAKWRAVHGPDLSLMGFLQLVSGRINPYSGVSGSHLVDPIHKVTKLCIKKLVDENILAFSSDDGIRIITLSDDYLTKETQDFTLDEAYDYDVISPEIQKKISDYVIDKVSGLNDEEEGYTIDYLSYMATIKFMDGTGSSQTEDRIEEIIRALHDEGKIKITPHWHDSTAWTGDTVKISPDYVEKETENFNLDEGRVQQKKYYSEELGPRLGKKFKFNEEAIRNLIIYELMHEDGTTFFRQFRDRIFEIVTERKSIWSSKVAEIFEDYVASLIKKMVSEKIIKWSDNPDGFWGPIIKLSDDFIDKEVSDFNLDEGVQRSANLFATDENGNIIFDDAALRSKVVIWLTSNEIEQDDTSFTSEELANEIIWDNYLKPIAIEQGEFPENSWNAPNVVDVVKRMSIVIDNMFNTGTLDHGPGGAMQVSSSHIDKETSDFNLDEGIEDIASKSFTIKNSFATFNRAVIKEMILDLVIDSISKDESLESYEIRTILQPKIGQYWKEKQDKWAARSTYQYENFLTSLSNVIHSLIDNLVDEDVLAYEVHDYETLVVLSDKYLGKITKDFNLDE